MKATDKFQSSKPLVKWDGQYHLIKKVRNIKLNGKKVCIFKRKSNSFETDDAKEVVKTFRK